MTSLTHHEVDDGAIAEEREDAHWDDVNEDLAEEV